MNGASLIAKNLPLQDQFNIIEDLMLAFCEKVALPCFLARDANPDLYSYLSYLKTQVEAKPCEGDFETIRVMGKGGFGLVKGCKTLRTGKMYALKEMDLKHVTKKKAKVLCDAEHACLTHPVVADSPFIVSLIYAFQSSKNVAGHAFFSSLNWSVLRNDPDPDTIEGSDEAPPFQPGNSLNVEDPEEIGTFPDLPDVVVDPSLFPENQWLYVSETKYQEEVVWLLQYQEKNDSKKKSSSFCTIA